MTFTVISLISNAFFLLVGIHNKKKLQSFFLEKLENGFKENKYEIIYTFTENF